MSDFSFEFGAFYVGVITLVSMITCAVLLHNRTLSTVSARVTRDE
jgi:hypothetical protein